jgi:hypothetical protein
VGAGVWCGESGEVGAVLCVDVIRRLVLVIISIVTSLTTLSLRIFYLSFIFLSLSHLDTSLILWRVIAIMVRRWFYSTTLMYSTSLTYTVVAQKDG